MTKFQHTAARRRLPDGFGGYNTLTQVSTHSRPKAAATMTEAEQKAAIVSTHSRPKAAARSFNSLFITSAGFNTQPPEGGCVAGIVIIAVSWWFQHTAARRRLPVCLYSQSNVVDGFNTQPPEGGCTCAICSAVAPCGFNTQPPEGGCLVSFEPY